MLACAVLQQQHSTWVTCAKPYASMNTKCMQNKYFTSNKYQLFVWMDFPFIQIPENYPSLLVIWPFYYPPGIIFRAFNQFGVLIVQFHTQLVYIRFVWLIAWIVVVVTCGHFPSCRLWPSSGSHLAISSSNQWVFCTVPRWRHSRYCYWSHWPRNWAFRWELVLVKFDFFVVDLTHPISNSLDITIQMLLKETSLANLVL